MRPEIHVYANPTIDYIYTPRLGWRGPRPGGPGLYAARLVGGEARVLIYGCHGGEELVARGYEEAGAILAAPPQGMTTVFHLVYRDGAETRRLVLDSFCGEVPCIESGEAALVAPVYRELGESHVAAIASRYPYLVVDVQGFARRRLPGGEVVSDPSSVSLAVEMMARRCTAVFKLGVDDLGPRGAARLLMEAVRNQGLNIVVTMGYRGLIACIKGKLYHVAACGPKADDPTGLGDGFSARLLLRLLRGDDILEACIGASEDICRYLGGSECSCGSRRLSLEEAINLLEPRRARLGRGGGARP